jgi:hypothetical protein
MNKEILLKVSQQEFHTAMKFMAGSIWTVTSIEQDETARGEPVTFVSHWFKNKDGDVFGAVKHNFKSDRQWSKAELDDSDCMFHFLNIDMIGLVEHLMDEERENESA